MRRGTPPHPRQPLAAGAEAAKRGNHPKMPRFLARQEVCCAQRPRQDARRAQHPSGLSPRVGKCQGPWPLGPGAQP